jgi:uncharacterized protein (UPF0332 family)
MQQARDRLADAEAILTTAHPAVVVSAAYYGMLYAARAALSERGEFAKTHSGTWTLFSQVFVAPGEFDQRLSALARRAKDAREEGDYEAAPASAEEAAGFVKGTAELSLRLNSSWRTESMIRGYPSSRSSHFTSGIRSTTSPQQILFEVLEHQSERPTGRALTASTNDVTAT